jgi:lipopolysaccharide transport system ATP-binding protein
MSDTVIKVKNLSKRYRLGELHRQSGSFREKVTHSLRSAFSSIDFSSNTKRRVPCLKPSPSDNAIWALRNVSFEVKRGEIVGIIGNNGAGKSTLLKILSRIAKPTEGKAFINGRVGSLLEVGTGFHSELTGRENIFLNGAILGMSKAEIMSKFDEIVNFSEIEKFIDTPVKRYSSGMYVRLAFAVAAHLEPEILLVDEVLAVGDIAFQKKCLGKIEHVADKGRTVLFVSHNLGVIESLCNQGIYLKSGKICYSGPVYIAINSYLSSFHNIRNETPGVLFEVECIKENSFQILNVSLLDKNLKMKPTLKTWDYLRIRLHYYSPEVVLRGSAVIEIYSKNGNRLIQYSTKPLSGVDLSFKPGVYHVDCVFPQFPLAAGKYRLAVGLAIPMSKWLCYEDNIAPIEVADYDIYKSHFPPRQDRSPLAVEHYWEV